MGSPTPRHDPDSHGRLSISGSGSVLLGGSLQLAFTTGPYATGDDVVQLFTTTGLVSGSFSSVSATGLEAGQSAVFDAVTGFVSIRAVPEPATITLLGVGAGLAGLMRRARRKPSAA